MKTQKENTNCCDFRTRDECPRHRNFWFAYVLVSKAAPDVRYSQFYDTLKEIKEFQNPINGTKIIKVKVIPE